MWRHADTKAVASRLLLYHIFIPELIHLQTSLELYSLCEKHYNQIISTNHFYQFLLNPDQTTSFQNQNKRKRHSIDNSVLDIGLNITSTCDFGAQFPEFETTCDFGAQFPEFEASTRDFGIQVSGEFEYVQTISKIQQLQKQLENQGRELMELSGRLTKANEYILNDRNQVIVKFIEILTQNDGNTNVPNQEKLFKRVVAVDAIYGSRHGKYVSEINLAASAIKYSLARSKKVINIDNHITSAGGYVQFQKWLDELSKEQESLPKGLLFLAFDNEQRGQKNYLDRGFNTVIFHVITSFVAFNMKSQNEIQHTNIPWLHNSLNRLQYEELFDLSSQMEEEFNKELHNYLSKILDQLCMEKLSSNNSINTLIESMISNNGYDKYCSNYESKIAPVPQISMTQRSVADEGVCIPEIYIPDPLNINPNLIANVEKVLQHIKKISGIQDGTRKWVIVTCDGVPYHHAVKLQEKFPWEIDLKKFAIHQGYQTENQLSYFKKCNDHHKAWDSICNIYREAMSLELIWPYVESQPNPTVDGYNLGLKSNRI
ncbi:hypothetical protein GLOIN_2v1770734 [Rhizophagus irregularis DAOM 181602=DAOM 197198]|nr:hypothetical protein GLOIN_2v1770734 [Rhizophagus irregularis DAOM 181602=DAOM 197198]